MAKESAQVTVFDSETDFTVKHPLNTPWTLWFDNPNRKRPAAGQWEANLRELVTMKSVEDFWGVVAHAKPVTELPLGSNYHMFRQGVKPAWEDPANTGGGKWTLHIPRGARREELFNEAWIAMMMTSIGECHTEYSDLVCGAVCSVRKSNDRISLWIATCERVKAESIGRFFKKACGFGDDDRIKFEAHPKDAHGKAKELFSV